ncbi:MULTISPECIES: 30S ribosomal protein S4 [Jutongia]|jgi:small subunit ribosomal protein S4|uniref:Small ribosomal subunit protein uS4 n=1 Tax=Jutongia huaianensis TaxID=2763668 RepID=A0ABR7N0W9_9FIRM|nr:30S ribosomal protein S4 [Jutongia huaianensis]MBS4816400.1 30S ribosomal protein S4 [Clostridium sp.]OKZ83484.1 MAG: 30S ribosomal protein S4 [Clostridium sp. 44_14]RHU98846.1 30S ribosomal protein S4 [Clostridium sp. OM07-9AC]RHV06193.1 30S ribosomal protein S4 [Clostridium sp. OM07-10AC]CDE68333.1 30S ribosomal protein S4 [Clostridium sp. CAG:277]
MARDMTPVLKRCRALGIEPAYMGLDKKSKRNVRAGRKPSEYALQLKEKQKAKFIYGVLEKPFRNNFAKAQKLKYGTTGENLMILLELRLDNVVFRMGYGRTRKEARQIVGHKHVLVNGKCVNIPSYTVKPGDKIEIKEKVKGYQRYKDVLETTEGRLIPDWLEADHETLTGTVKEIPTREQIDVPVNEVLIVELYSK